MIADDGVDAVENAFFDEGFGAGRGGLFFRGLEHEAHAAGQLFLERLEDLGRADQRGGVGVVSAGVHDAGHGGGVFKIVVLARHGQRVDVGADGHAGSGRVGIDVADEAAARAGEAAAEDGAADLFQLAFDRVGGAHFLPAQLGMAVKLAAERGHFVFGLSGQREDFRFVHDFILLFSRSHKVDQEPGQKHRGDGHGREAGNKHLRHDAAFDERFFRGRVAEAARTVASAISTVRYWASMARPSIIVPMCAISTGMNVIARLISPVILNRSAGIPSQKAAKIMAEETKRMETRTRVREAIRSPTVKKPSTTRID